MRAGPTDYQPHDSVESLSSLWMLVTICTTDGTWSCLLFILKHIYYEPNVCVSLTFMPWSPNPSKWHLEVGRPVGGNWVFMNSWGCCSQDGISVLIKRGRGVPAMVQRVKHLTSVAWLAAEVLVQSPAQCSGLENLALLQVWLRFSPWSRNFNMPQVRP